MRSEVQQAGMDPIRNVSVVSDQAEKDVKTA
jgi:hypothetical protein